MRALPLAHKQFIRQALILSPGLNGYRLSFVGGATFEVVGEIASLEGAIAAHGAALALWDGFTAQRKTVNHPTPKGGGF
jgi:hypothetical protein